MIIMWHRKDHMYADEENIAVFAWPLREDWYPSEQGTKMLDKLWEIAYNYDLAVKV